MPRLIACWTSRSSTISESSQFFVYALRLQGTHRFRLGQIKKYRSHHLTRIITNWRTFSVAKALCRYRRYIRSKHASFYLRSVPPLIIPLPEICDKLGSWSYHRLHLQHPALQGWHRSSSKAAAKHVSSSLGTIPYCHQKYLHSLYPLLSFRALKPATSRWGNISPRTSRRCLVFSPDQGCCVKGLWHLWDTWDCLSPSLCEYEYYGSGVVWLEHPCYSSVILHSR